MSSNTQIVDQGAEEFLRLYYRMYDSPNRAVELPKLYRAGSTSTWNGIELEGLEAIRNFFITVPPSFHEIQSFDCQTVPGTTPPTLLITVSGYVMHGSDREAPSATTNKSVEDHPRIYSQSFVLMQDEEPVLAKPAAGAKSNKNPAAPTEPRYYVQTDTMRFVG